MGVTVDWFAGTFRCGPDHEKYGDDYELAVTCFRHGDMAVLFAATGSLSLSDFKKLKEMLWEMGVKTISFHRAGKPIKTYKTGE